MTDEELRSLVRDAVARHLNQAWPRGFSPGGTGAEASNPGDEAAGPNVNVPGPQVAFHRYALPRGDDGDGSCLIEPKVRCNHCGFCQSHGY
jgi:hypothetical protein